MKHPSQIMKKVCFVQARAYYLFNPNTKNASNKVGGAQKQMYLLSLALAEDNNFNVHFLVADFGQKKRELVENVSIWKSFSFSQNIFVKLRKLLQTLKQIGADIYIFRSADIGVAFAIFFVKNILRKKVLYMLASDIELTFQTQKNHSGFISAKAMQWVYKNTDILLTAQTKTQKNILLKNRGRQANEIIKNIYTKNINSNRKLNKKNTILWVGRLTENKKPDLFIELAKKYPNEKFIMIAPIVRDFIKFGEKTQSKIKAVKNITLINYVKPNEIFSYYINAKIYVLTSEFEGFSNTMAEAMIAKCPILSFNVSPDKILEEYNCGLNANNRLEDFYLFFKNLNSNAELRTVLGENGANYIKENHQKNIITSKFKDLLNQA